MAIVDDAFKLATSGLNFKKSEDRLRADYAMRRAHFLHNKNAAWDATRLSNQIKAEQTGILQYLDTKRTLIAGTESVKPTHLDLKAVAKYRTRTGSPAIDGNIKRIEQIGEEIFRSDRRSWVPQIVWRAVAIHDALWSSLGPPPKLALAALDELLDRRLRAIEQIVCNVNAFVGLPQYLDPPNRTSWSVGGPNGPWKDGFLTRNFEYPYLPSEPFTAFQALMPDWRVAGARLMIYEPKPHGKPVLMGKDIRSHWAIEGTGTLWVKYKPKAGVKFSDVIRRMFDPPREDFLDRNILFCDQVASAVGIEALCFGLRRRHGNDDVFNKIPDTAPDYVYLGPVVRFDRTHDKDILMADDNDPFFENREIEIEDLQVGDNVRFWNSRIYDALVGSGAWGSEFSYVMGIDVDAKGKLQIPQIRLAGHGVETSAYNQMAAQLIGGVRSSIVQAAVLVNTHGAGRKELQLLGSGQTMERWEPYEAFDGLGAWWVRVPKTTWKDNWDYATINDVLTAVPRTVAHDSAKGGTGYHPPLDTEAAYFPLFEPALAYAPADGDSWRTYLNKRKSDASFRVPTTLRDLAVDARLAQGLFYRGARSTKVPVVRPKVTV